MDTTELRSLIEGLKDPKDEKILQDIRDWSRARWVGIARQNMTRANYESSLQSNVVAFVEKHRKKKTWTRKEATTHLLEYWESLPQLNKMCWLGLEDWVQLYALEKIIVVTDNGNDGKIDELEKLQELLQHPAPHEDVIEKICEHEKNIQADLDDHAREKKWDKYDSRYLWFCLFLSHWMQH